MTVADANQGLLRRNLTTCVPRADDTAPTVLGHDQPVPTDVIYRDNILLLNTNYLLRLMHCPLETDTTSSLWVVKNKAGFTAVIGTWLFVIVGEIVFFLIVIIPFHDPLYSAAHGTFSLACAFLGLVAHFQATFSNPVRHKYP